MWKAIFFRSAGFGAGFAAAIGLGGLLFWYFNRPKPPTNSKAAITVPARVPTLGFAQIKDVAPVFDADAYDEELRLKKALPNNELVGDQRAFHQVALMNDFLDGFKDSKECNGITFYMKASGKKPDFVVQIHVSGHDRSPDNQTWVWMLFQANQSAKDSNTLAGMGTQSTAILTARDVCLTVWDDVDPNHFPKPGGKVEVGEQ